MLCLGRKVDERIICESAETGRRLLEIVVLRAGDGKVRLGLVGDQHVRIMRAELLDDRPTPAEAACEESDAATGETAVDNAVAPAPLSMPLPAWYADLPSIGGE
jgi:sRNA-binding carbon storage regulator CsrA